LGGGGGFGLGGWGDFAAFFWGGGWGGAEAGARAELLAYCQRDTLALLEVYRALNSVAS
jgi:hypothetical protein